jgi:DNA-binding NarL/FixJ family response regulator
MVVDLSLRDSSGLELLSEVPSRWPDLPVLVVSMKEESFYAERVLRAGARGFLSKDRASSELAQALETILDGGVYASAETSTRIIGAATTGSQPGRSSLELLTNREFTVLEMIGSGLPPRKIAEKLHISPKTVDSHREHIKTKLNLPDAAALTRFAIEWTRGEQGAAGEA